MTVLWPFLLLLARGAALISTVSPLLIFATLGFAGLRGRDASRAARRSSLRTRAIVLTVLLVHFCLTDVSSLATLTLMHLVSPSHPLLVLHACLSPVSLVSCLHLVHFVVVHLFVSLEHFTGSV